MPERLNFWQEPEWIKLKSSEEKTEKLLSRVEYLRLVGYKNYSDENYKKYLQTMKQGSEDCLKPNV